MADSETYTHGHHESVLAAHRWRTIANSALYLEPHLRSGRSLLDVGCGPGTITAEFADRLSPGRVVGVDSAPDALAAAGELTTTAEFVLGDAYGLPFDDGSFDIVHTHQTLQHVKDPVGMLREMARVARRGGVVAAREVDYSATTWFPLLPELELWLDLVRRVHRANGGEPDAGRHLTSWALEAGLSASQVTASAWAFSTAQQRAWWGGAWAQRALHSRFATDAVGGGHATARELQSISDAWSAWAADDRGFFTMTHTELLATV
ncbi:MAG: methyltransferase domain-containing protein [Microcella sp.]|uniref:methyltransferase domain-containing protein n=1 Tax=Microcella sp. TaxID=1913979 RepID=UPI003315187D